MSAVTPNQPQYIYSEIDTHKDGQKGIQATLYDSLSRPNKIWKKLFDHTIEYKGKLYTVDWNSFHSFIARNKFGCWKDSDMSGAKANIFQAYKAYENVQKAKNAETKDLMTAISWLNSGKISEMEEISLEVIFNIIALPPRQRKEVMDKLALKEGEPILPKATFLEILTEIDHKLPEQLSANFPSHLKEKAEKCLTDLKNNKDELEKK